jgi:hypothetical protein
MQERLYHMEQRDSIISSPPLAYVPPRDPMELYNEACVAYANEASSRRHGKSTAAPLRRSTLKKKMTTTTIMVMMVTMRTMRTMRMSSWFFDVAYPFWHLLTKGECWALIYLCNSLVGRLVLRL